LEKNSFVKKYKKVFIAWFFKYSLQIFKTTFAKSLQSYIFSSLFFSIGFLFFICAKFCNMFFAKSEVFLVLLNEKKNTKKDENFFKKRIFQVSCISWFMIRFYNNFNILDRNYLKHLGKLWLFDNFKSLSFVGEILWKYLWLLVQVSVIF